jgi:hypothetical protein
VLDRVRRGIDRSLTFEHLRMMVAGIAFPDQGQ